MSGRTVTNTTGVTDDTYREQAYGMLRKRKNPKPNICDRIMFEFYTKLGVYLPITAFFAIFDFAVDWRNSFQLMGTEECHLNAFGLMMLLTVTAVPVIFALISPAEEEQIMWDFIIRMATGNMVDPLDEEEEEREDPGYIWWISYLCYVIFSPFTCIVSQVQLHLTQTHAIGYYQEFTKRSKKVIRQLYAGSFEDYDQKDFDSLKELQIRATHYVKYYVAFCKDRLKFCLVEDCIQFNIQMTMFLYRYFSYYKSSPIEYENMDGLWFADKLSPDRIVFYDTIIKVMGTASAVLMIWIGYYSTEKTHEQLVKREQIGMIRVLAIGCRIIIELIVPAFCMTMFIVSSGENNALQAPDAKLYVKGCDQYGSVWSTLRIYGIFPFAFTLVTHFSWSFLLNVTNQGVMTKERTLTTLQDTWRNCIYNSFITIKYTRLGSPLETVPQPYKAGLRQHVLLFLSLFFKFSLPLAIFLAYIPDNFRPKDQFTLDPDNPDELYRDADIDYRVQYGLTNDIHYLSYLRFNDKVADYSRIQVSPVYLADDDEYWIEPPIVNITSELEKYDNSSESVSDFEKQHQDEKSGKTKLKVVQFRNKHDYYTDEKTTFSFLYTYDYTDDIPIPEEWKPPQDDSIFQKQFNKPYLQRLTEAYGCSSKAELIAKMQLKHLKAHNYTINCYETSSGVDATSHPHLSGIISHWNDTDHDKDEKKLFESIETFQSNTTHKTITMDIDVKRELLLKYIALNEKEDPLMSKYRTNLKAMSNDLRTKADAEKLYNQWYEVIIEHPVMKGQPKERSQYEFNEFIYTMTGNPGNRERLQSHLFYYWFLFVVCFHILYIMGEMDHPTWSSVLRVETFENIYPLTVPCVLTFFAVYFEFKAVEKASETFCRMHPEVNNNLFGMVGLNCQSEGASSSMTRCAYGTTCYYMSYPDLNTRQVKEYNNAKQWTLNKLATENQIKRIPFYMNMRVQKLEAEALGRYSETPAYDEELQCDGKKKATGCMAAPSESTSNYNEDAFKTKDSSERYSSLRYLNSKLRNLFIEVFGMPSMTSLVCVFNEDLKHVQFGDVIWDDHDNEGKVTVPEVDKCMDAYQGIVTFHQGYRLPEEGGVQRFYAGKYNDTTNALTEAEVLIDDRFDSMEPADDDQITTSMAMMPDVTGKRKAHSELLKKYLKQALECYQLKSWYYYEYTKVDTARSVFHFWYSPDYRHNGTDTAFDPENEGFWSFFHESCTDRLSEVRLFSRKEIKDWNLWSRDDVKHLMRDFVDSATTSYMVMPDGDKVEDGETDSRQGMLVNWPVDITQDSELVVLKEHEVLGMPYLITKIDLDVDKYKKKTAKFNLTEDWDPDSINDLPLFNPEYHYSPESLKRHFGHNSGTKIGSGDLHIDLPWWTTCDADRDEFAKHSDGQQCIYFDDPVKEGYYNASFAFWKLKLDNELNTEDLAKLLHAALQKYDDFETIVKDNYGPRQYALMTDDQTMCNLTHELPYYEHNTNIIDAERYRYLETISQSGRATSKYMKTNCFYNKFRKGGNNAGNDWATEFDGLTADSYDQKDAMFIINQLTMHEIKKHVIAAFLNNDVDISGDVTFPLTMDENDYKRESAKEATSAWPWRVGTQYKRDNDGKFYCVDPSNATWTEEHDTQPVISCIKEWELYQFDYIAALQEKAYEDDPDWHPSYTAETPNRRGWLGLNLHDKSVYEVGKDNPYFWSINAKPWLHRQLAPLAYKTEVFKKSESCTDCFLDWKIENWRDDDLMKYKLTRKMMFVPFWPDWQVYQKYVDVTNDDTKFEDWKQDQPEHVNLQNEKDPWDIETAAAETTYLSSGCVITDSENNVRVIGVGMNMDDDTIGTGDQTRLKGLGWSGHGYNSRSQSLDDSDPSNPDKRQRLTFDPYVYDTSDNDDIYTLNQFVKSFYDLDVQHTWNLNFVNTYIATINFHGSDSGNVKVVDEWEKFQGTNYAATIQNTTKMNATYGFTDDVENEPINIQVAFLETGEPETKRLINGRTEKYMLQRVKKHLSNSRYSSNNAFHYFGRDWNSGTFSMVRQYYQQFGSSFTRYSAKILDFDYSYFNLLPSDALYVAVNSNDESNDKLSESENYLDGMLSHAVETVNNGLDEQITEQLNEFHDRMKLHSPALELYNEDKTYTQFQSNDLHITDKCIVNPQNPDEVFVFGTVRRLKPFYYYYCDKWNPDFTNYNPQFDVDYKNNYTDKFGRLDSLLDTDGNEVEDQAYLITHNFIEPKKENAQTFRLSDFNYICDNNLINEEDTIFNFPNDTWISLHNIYKDWLESTGGNQATKSSIYKMEKTWIEAPFGNAPLDQNLMKERFVPYFSSQVPASPVMAELYWDAHDDLVDPNRYDMGTEAHPGVYALSFLGHQDFQIEVNKTKWGGIMKEDSFKDENGDSVYLDSDAKFYTGGYTGKNDDNPFFPSRHLQYHLHPKWQQKYPRQGPLRDVEADAFQKSLQNICKKLDVQINQKYYIDMFTDSSQFVNGQPQYGSHNRPDQKRPVATGERKQFRPEWSYAQSRRYTDSDGNVVTVPEWNKTTRWNPNQRNLNMGVKDFKNEFFWATTNRPAELFNYTYAWNNDADFRRHRSFAERVLLGNRVYQPDHSFMEQSGIDTKWFGLWRAPDWKTGTEYVAGTRDLTVQSPPLHFLGYLPPVETVDGRSSTWNHPLATSLITRYPDYKEYQTYATQARRMNGAVWREWEAYMPKAGYTPSPNVKYFYSDDNNGTLTIEFDLEKYFSPDSAYSWEVKTPWSRNCAKDANAVETDEWVAENCGNELYGTYEFYNPKKLIPLSFAALDMRPDLLSHGFVPGTAGVVDSNFPKGRKNQMYYYPRWIRDPLPFAPEQTLYNERTREIFPGATLYLGDKGKLRAHHGGFQSAHALDQMVPGNLSYPDPFRFPWRYDFLVNDENPELNYKFNSTIKGLHHLENKMVDDTNQDINLTTFGFMADYKPNLAYKPTMIRDNFDRLVQFPTVRRTKEAEDTGKFAICEGIWNLFPVDPFKLAFRNNFTKPLSRFDQALLFRTEYDRGNSRIGPKEYGFDTSKYLPIVDNYHVEPGQSELAFGLLANPMLFKNNLSFIDIGYETGDGNPQIPGLSLNDIMMASFYENPLMWSGLDDKFQQSYYERYQSSQSYKYHFSGQVSLFPIDAEATMVRSQGFRSVYGFNQWGRPVIYKDATAREKKESFELVFHDPMNLIESIAVKPGGAHDTGLPWMYYTFVADRKEDDDDYLRFIAGHKERMPFWRKEPTPQNESHLVEPNPRWRWDKVPPSLEWGITQEEIDEWKDITNQLRQRNLHYRKHDIEPIYSRKHFDENSHPLRPAQKWLKYFMEPFVIDQNYQDKYKQYLRKDRRMLRPGWSVEEMAEYISNMEAHMGKEFYQLFHYEDIGRFCSNNYIPNIDHRWYYTNQVVEERGQEKYKDKGDYLDFAKPDGFLSNFMQVDENQRIQDLLPQNIMESILTNKKPFWTDNPDIETPKESRAKKHPYELPTEENPYFREYQGAKVPDDRQEVPMIRNFDKSWETLDIDRTFYKPTKHFTKYDDANPLFTLTGYELIDKEYVRNVDDMGLKGLFYLQLQNKNIPYPKEKPAPTNFVPKLLSIMKMIYSGEQNGVSHRLMHVNGGDFQNCIVASMANTTRDDYYITRAESQARDFHLYGYRYACKGLYESKRAGFDDWSDEQLKNNPGCSLMPNYANMSAHIDETEYIPINYLGLPATKLGDKLYGNRVGDKEWANSEPYDASRFNSLNPINPTTFIPAGVEQVDFNYCEDWKDLDFHLDGMTSGESIPFKFGPDMHWMRLYDNYLNNHLYENDGVGGNFGNYDDLIQPPIHDTGSTNIHFSDPRYYGDHGSGKHAGVTKELFDQGQSDMIREELVPDASKIAETADQRHTAWSKMDIYSMLTADFFAGSSGKNLETMRNLYSGAGTRWMEPGKGGYNALGDTDIIDDSLPGAQLKFLNPNNEIESKELRAIDPREQFFASFEDELGLTAKPLKDVIENFATETIVDGVNALKAMTKDELKEALFEEAKNFPVGYKHDMSDYEKFKYDSSQDVNKPVCSSRIFDPLGRFQPWDTYPQLLNLDSLDGSSEPRGNFEDTTQEYTGPMPFILADPMIVAPYSLAFKITFDTSKARKNQAMIKLDSVIKSGLSPQYGACTTVLRHLDHPTGDGYDRDLHDNPDKPKQFINRQRLVPVCFGGVVMGKLTNKAIIYDYKLLYHKDKKGDERVSHDTSGVEQWVSDHRFDLPLPMMHHSALSTGTSIYVFGGKIPFESQLDGDGEMVHHQLFPFVLRFKTNCPLADSTCRKWERIMVPRQFGAFNNIMPSSRQAMRFQSSRQSTMYQPAGAVIHSELHFCPSDLNAGANSIPVERWTYFGDKVSAAAGGSSRRRRDASTMYYDNMIDRYDGINTDNVNWAALLGTFHQTDAPNRVQSVDAPRDQSVSQYGQKCMWCDVGNNAIDLVRVPFENNEYLNQIQPPVFTPEQSTLCKKRHIVAKVYHKSMRNTSDIVDNTISTLTFN